MNETYSIEKAAIELNRLVSDWLNSKENRNVALLARSSKVSENCIHRILKSNSMPKAENLQKLVSFIKGPESNQNVFGSLEENLQKHIKFELSYLDFEESKSYVGLGPKEDFLKDFTHHAIFELASMNSGVEISELQNQFGTHGLKVVDSLQKANLVKVVDNRVLAQDEYRYHTSSGVLQKRFLVGAAEEYFKLESNVNYLYTHTGKVTSSGYSQVMDVVEAAHKAIWRIVDTNEGTIPLVVGGFMDSMTANNIFATGENENENI